MRTALLCRLPRRLAAIVYDGIVLIALLFFGALPPTLLYGEGITAPLPTALMLVYQLAIAFAFFGGFWTHGGQTIGMRAWRIRVVGIDGKSIGWRAAFVRFVMATAFWATAWTGLWWGVLVREVHTWSSILVVTCLAAVAGFWWGLFDRDGLTWHDRLSSTRLVHIPRSDDPDSDD